MSRVSNCGAFRVDGEPNFSTAAEDPFELSVQAIVINQDVLAHRVEVVMYVDGNEVAREIFDVEPPGDEVQLSQSFDAPVDSPFFPDEGDVSVTMDLDADIPLTGAECEFTEDCPPGEVCIAGVCLPEDAGGLAPARGRAVPRAFGRF